MRWVLWLLLFSCPTSATKVLLIESYHSEYEWDKSYLQGMRETLIPSIELKIFQMDVKRVPPNQYEMRAKLAMREYVAFRPDIVVLGDDDAFQYMWPKLYDEPISVVFLGINTNPRKLLSNYSGNAEITGVLERPLFAKSIEELRRVVPDDNFKVRILFDSGATSRTARSYIQSQYAVLRRKLGIEVEVVAAATVEQWQESIDTADDDGISVLIVGYYQTLVDRVGNIASDEEIIRWSNKHSDVPLFAFWDFSVGTGKAAGGFVLVEKSQGVEAAHLVNKIANGEPANSIPIKISNQGRALYSISAMEKWGITPPSDWVSIETIR